MFDWLRRFWNFIDERDIDKHVISLLIMLGTFKVTFWAMDFAETVHNQPGLEVAAIIGAVLGPYMALQAAAIKFYFTSRTNP